VNVPTLGRFYNAGLDGTRLVGEFWLDKGVLMSSEDGEALFTKIKNSHPIEVSTGYYAESVPKTGKWNDKDYALVDTNLRPDHIAVLPDDIGACSLEDGCGLNRNRANVAKLHKNVKLNREESLDQKGTRIRSAFMAFISKPQPGQPYLPEDRTGAVPIDVYVTEIFSEYLIVVMTGNLYKVAYADFGENVAFDEMAMWQPVSVEYVTNLLKTHGGEGSGHFGHDARPGKGGGSQPRGGDKGGKGGAEKEDKPQSSAVREVSKGIQGYSELSKTERAQKIEALSKKKDDYLGMSLDTLRTVRSEYIDELITKYGKENVMKGKYPDKHNAILDDMDAYEKMLVVARSKKVKSNSDLDPAIAEGFAHLLVMASE